MHARLDNDGLALDELAFVNQQTVSDPPQHGWLIPCVIRTALRSVLEQSREYRSQTR